MSSENQSEADYLLAIESSCDETAAAIIDRCRNVHSSIIASQTQLHEMYGGVVPEIASRAHLERIIPVIDESLKQARITFKHLSAIAVMTEPGLVGSLLVGLTAAKTLAWSLKLPLISVNHIEAHLYACQMFARDNLFPAIGLVVSGGHSNLYLCSSATKYELLSSTLDDAVGEAYDKVAQILGLPYPGGPEIEQAARNGNPRAFAFPRPLMKKASLDFSFSGLKTAVLYEVQGVPNKNEVSVPPLTSQRVADIAASFQAAVIDVLTEKTKQAIRQFQLGTLCVGGGVAINSALRFALQEMCTAENVRLVIAPPEMCTDNAAMGGLAWEHYEEGDFADLSLDVNPGLVRA